MSTVQPMPRPATVAGFIRYRDEGRLVDLTGQPIRLEPCTSCDGEHLGAEPCHVDVRCPDCGSTARQCHRPSEHGASEWHADRFAELERVTLSRIAAGETRIAAPWRPTEHDQGALF